MNETNPTPSSVDVKNYFATHRPDVHTFKKHTHIFEYDIKQLPEEVKQSYAIRRQWDLKDFREIECDCISEKECQKHIDYWLNKFAEDLFMLNLRLPTSTNETIFGMGKHYFVAQKIVEDTIFYPNLCDRKNMFFNPAEWQIVMFKGSSKLPPHLMLYYHHNIEDGFMLRIDINDVRVIGEKYCRTTEQVWEMRRKYCSNIQNMKGVATFEQIYDELLKWYRSPSLHTFVRIGVTNYWRVANHWRIMTGQDIYDPSLDMPEFAYFCMPKTKEELEYLVKSEITIAKKKVREPDLSYIDVRNITDFSGLFEGVTWPFESFNLSSWDMSKATNISRMFKKTNVGRIIFPQCDFSSVTDASELLADSTAMVNLSKLNLSRECNLENAFQNYAKPLSTIPEWMKNKGN